jgi:hypothetical protein
LVISAVASVSGHTRRCYVHIHNTVYLGHATDRHLLHTQSQFLKLHGQTAATSGSLLLYPLRSLCSAAASPGHMAVDLMWVHVGDGWSN